MPLVYIPDAHLAAYPPSHGFTSAPSASPYGYPHQAYPSSPFAASAAPFSRHPHYQYEDALAARKQALLDDFAQSLNSYYPASAPTLAPHAAPHRHQHHHLHLLQQKQREEQLERQRAEAALIQAVEEQRIRQALARRAAAVEERRRELARLEEEREKQILLKEVQKQEALRQHLIQQRQAAYEQQLADARQHAVRQQQQRQKQQQQQQQQQRLEATHPLENLLRLCAGPSSPVAEQPTPAKVERPSAPGRQPSEPQQKDIGIAALEQFLGSLFSHCAAATENKDEQSSSAAPKNEEEPEPQPPVAHQRISHPSVAGPSLSSSAAVVPARPSTPPPAAAAPVKSASLRSPSPVRPASVSALTTPHSRLTALFARLRTVASSSNSLMELQHHLTEILVAADAIEANDDEGVRARRRELVREVEKVLGGLEKKEAEKNTVAAPSSDDSTDKKDVTTDATEVAAPEPTMDAASATDLKNAPASAPENNDSALSVAPEPVVEEPPSPPALASEAPSPASPSPSADAAPILIPIHSAPSSPVARPAADDDSRSDVSSVASPLLAAAADDDARSVRSASSTSSSRRGRKAYVEDAPEEDDFRLV